MDQNRREFLKTAAVGAGCLALAGCDFEAFFQQIANRPTRKDVNSLAQNDPIIEAYKSAVSQMKNLPPNDNRNWINQANIHANFCPHGNWLFLPWHRWYLTYFERICQRLSGMSDFALPYWNWVKDPAVPAVFWGDPATNPLYDATRTIGQNIAISPFVVGCKVVGDIMDDPNFITFASDSITLAQGQRTGAGFGALEGTPHNGVHGAVGGNMGAVALSPRDPIFWLHHNMIEKCWVEWQLVRNNSNTDDADWLDRHFTEFYDADGKAVDVTVGIGLLLPALSYQFDDLPVIPASCAGNGPPPPAPAGAGSFGAGWRKLNSVKTKTGQEALKHRAESGAAVKLEIVRRYALGRAASVAVGEPASVPIPIEAAAVRSALAAGHRALIRLNGVTLDHTTDFFAKVFIDKPDAGPSTPHTDPHFVGAFAFFNHQHGGSEAGTRGDVHLDASAAMRRLAAVGTPLNVSVVLEPFPNRELKSNSLDVASIEIQIVKDLIDKHEK
jgi:tyrosinase